MEREEGPSLYLTQLQVRVGVEVKDNLTFKSMPTGISFAMLHLRSIDKPYATSGKGQGRHGHHHGIGWIFENELGYQTISNSTDM